MYDPVVLKNSERKVHMIHKYKLAGYNIVIDVNSGAIHAVDDLTYDILDNIEPPFAPSCPENVLEKLQKFHRKEDIWTCYNEVTELYREKLLFSDEEVPEPEKTIPPLRALCLNISHDCNLRCDYCFAAGGSFGGDRMLMSPDTAERAVDLLIEKSGNIKNLEIYFFGGEPLINFKTMEATVRYARSKERECGKSFRFSVTTNGTLLDDEKTEFINRDMSGVVLSVDGRRETNDSMRVYACGGGTYDSIIPKYRKLLEGRGNSGYYIRGTFTKKNLDFSEDVFSLLDAGFKHISIEPVMKGVAAEYTVTELELPRVFREYDILLQRMIELEKSGQGFDFFHFDIDTDGMDCLRKKTRGCGCGNEYAAVTPSGDIYPCHQFIGDSEMCLGNINSGTLNDDIRKIFASADINTKKECRECWAKYFCSGGCNACNYHSCGDVRCTHKMSCLLMKKRIECAIVLKVFRAERQGKI